MSPVPKSLGSLLIIGAGGHAKAVVGAAKVTGYDVRAVYDDDPEKWGKGMLGVPIFGPINRILDAPRMPVIVGIADATIRKTLVERLPLEWATLIHKTAVVDPTVKVAAGAVVFAGVVIQADANIGAHAIVNANATVSHDCHIDKYVHLAPGVDLANGVHISTGAFLGVGAVVLPNVQIGAWSIVGAGAAVTLDLPDNVVAVGCPARVIRTLHEKNASTTVDYG
jgi:sugar O-acyltransferase (sialic acid O-acetyltransferase NeuD family)